VQLKESLELIEQLKIAIDEKHSAFDIECGKIQSEVTPQQTVRFLLWISKSVDKIGNVSEYLVNCFYSFSFLFTHILVDR
jgi:hypothetical protein